MIYEKDNILSEALDYIVTVRYEGQATNNDFLGYWSKLSDTVLNVSTASLKAGIASFYEQLKTSKDTRELMGYHFRLMTTLINNNAVIHAAEELFTVLAHSLRNEIDNDVTFDLIKSRDELHYLSGFDKVLLLMHIYQDRIDCALAAILAASVKGKTKK